MDCEYKKNQRAAAEFTGSEKSIKKAGREEIRISILQILFILSEFPFPGFLIHYFS
jgi:hypothetical protein